MGDMLDIYSCMSIVINCIYVHIYVYIYRVCDIYSTSYTYIRMYIYRVCDIYIL